MGALGLGHSANRGRTGRGGATRTISMRGGTGSTRGRGRGRTGLGMLGGGGGGSVWRGGVMATHRRRRGRFFRRRERGRFCGCACGSRSAERDCEGVDGGVWGEGDVPSAAERMGGLGGEGRAGSVWRGGVMAISVLAGVWGSVVGKARSTKKPRPKTNKKPPITPPHTRACLLLLVAGWAEGGRIPGREIWRPEGESERWKPDTLMRDCASFWYSLYSLSNSASVTRPLRLSPRQTCKAVRISSIL